jgi:hypothetical protein
MGILFGILGGGIITIATAIFVEWLRTPKLELSIEDPPHDVPNDQQPEKRHLRVRLRNKPLHPYFRWMLRSAALQCRGEITFHNVEGQNIFGTKAMPVRWVSSPAPVTVSGQIVDLHEPAEVISRIVGFTGVQSTIDVYPGDKDAQMLDVAVRFAGEQECYGWNNEAYFHNWRTPDWRLPRGTHLVTVVISSSGDKRSGKFRLMNEVDSLQGFTLTPLVETDKTK